MRPRLFVAHYFYRCSPFNGFLLCDLRGPGWRQYSFYSRVSKNEAVTNGQYLDAIWRSLEYALISTIVCLVIGYPLAFILANMEERHRNFIAVLFLIPMWMNFLIRTYALSSLINEQGIVTKFFQKLGLISGSITGTEGAIIIGMVYNFLPFLILPVYTSILKIDHRILEAARDLGANTITVFRKIVLPLTIPGIISGITMVFVPCITTFVIPQLLNNKVWTTEAWLNFSQRKRQQFRRRKQYGGSDFVYLDDHCFYLHVDFQ